MYSHLSTIFCLLFILQCSQSNFQESGVAISYSIPVGDKISGMTLVAPPRPFEKDPMIDIKHTNTAWVAIVPYAFTRPGDTKVHFNSERQWWGERAEGAKKSIALAHASDMKVMLKPQLWMHDSWTGDLEFKKNKDWEEWEEEYSEYIMSYLQIAQDMQVALFCIGTEFKKSSVARPQFWKSLIEKARALYGGKLVYAANWDEYEMVTFWDDLDYIGVDAYFPILNAPNPSKSQLVKAWQPTAKKLKAISKKYNKPLLFTEYGYLSVKGCTFNTWELEKIRDHCKEDHQAQATAFDALYEVFYNEQYWHGGFIWKWYPNFQGSSARNRGKDYTPQGKKSLEIISKWYGEE